MLGPFAHSIDGKPESVWEPLAQHLTEVADLAEYYTAEFGAGDWGKVAGALHDLGKLTPEFQARLRGATTPVDHSTAGALVAAQTYGWAGKLLAYAIAGHHAGLADWDGEGNGLTTLERRLDRALTSVPTLPPWEGLIPATPQTLSLPKLSRRKGLPLAQAREGASLMLFVRFVLSALVDADRLATEAFYRKADGRDGAPRGNWRSLAELKDRLDRHMSAFDQARSGLAQRRAEILAAARKAAAEPQGLFSLTVPTGGGKTLSSLAFALDHAVKHHLDRVIYVIPFTSIIDQTTRVFRDVVGDDLADHVIEHHSAFREDEALAALSRKDESALQAGERLRFATENWDAPIIVTTAVQFFESLFSNRTGRCRKLHNITRSVVVMDEAQTLPISLLRPTLAAIDDLVTHYGASIVLCTATQPAITATRAEGAEGLRGGLTGVREIIDRPDALYDALRRVTVNACTKFTPDELSDRLSALDRVLCIVGTRAQARDLYKLVRARTGDAGLYHLSALMCPAHRMAKLERIKTALASEELCRVVATTVVEAGVDVDFPVVWRQMTGLDSIAQAAGRCNREGKSAAEQSIVQLFEVDGWSGLEALRRNEDVAREVLRQPRFAADPLGLDAIQAYFERLYDAHALGPRDGLDVHAILGLSPRWMDGKLPFAEVAKLYRIIETTMEPVIVPWDERARGALAAIGDPALPADDIRMIARRLQPYIVNIPKEPFGRLKQARRIVPVNAHRFEEQFMRLTDEARDNIYSEDFGFDWSDPTMLAVEKLIF